MKKLTYKFWARIVACTAFILCAVLLVGCAVGVLICVSQEWYSEVQFDFYETNLYSDAAWSYWNKLYNFIYNSYYNMSEEAFVDCLDDYAANIELKVLLKDEDGNVLLDQTDETMKICLRTDFSIDNGDQESFKEFTMEIYLGDLIEHSRLWYLQQMYAWIYANRFVLIWAAVGLCIIELLLFIFCMCSAGHKIGEEGPVLIRQDKIPLDLHLAVCIVMGFVGLYIMEELFYKIGIIEKIICWGIFFAIVAFLGLAFCMTFAARVKAGKWWENTICYRIWKLFVRMVKAVVGGNVNFIKLLPLTWKTVGAYGAFVIINIFLSSITFEEQSFFAAFLMVMIDLVVLVAVAYVSYQAKELYKAGKELAQGKLDYVVDTSKMRFELKEHGEDLNSIGLGMSLAVDERMKSERLKTELITNVSHDLKTPLTSIVNYVDLLKKQPYGSPEAEEYVMVLDRQSAKLKKLTEDLVEASKASAGAISVDRQRINSVELLTQTLAEFESRFASANISPVMTVKTTHTEILADGRLLWRVLDNLLQNVCKYAMSGTRAYFDILESDGRLSIVIKNISAEPLNIPAEELMERFVRGDESRSTEGSGLGLSIARSLTELMGGGFNISLDGDLFKVEISFAILQ